MNSQSEEVLEEKQTSLKIFQNIGSNQQFQTTSFLISRWSLKEIDQNPTAFVIKGAMDGARQSSTAACCLESGWEVHVLALNSEDRRRNSNCTC